MNYIESVQYLLTLGRELAAPSHARAAKFELTNIRALTTRMDNPQNKFRSIHIAGTNGKGSTAAMMESVLSRAGYSTGLYTSPHLESINERIRLDGAPISDEEFAAAFTRLHELTEQMLGAGELAAHPTFFECLTAMALDVFARAQVEFAVLEVGLGGRLDSTNLVIPEISVITQIHFDHESFLGHSIAQIAGEKAGIIKRGVPVVSSAEDADAVAVIRERAKEMAAPLVEIDSAYSVENLRAVDGFYSADVFEKNGNDGRRITLNLSLAGRYQMRNAVTAVAVSRLLAGRGFHVADADIVEGIAAVRWPGRIEKITDRPAVYLDGTHNPSGARELAAFWREHLAGRSIHLVYGSVRDKSVDEIAGLLFPLAASVIVTAPKQPRALSAEALAEMTRHLAPKMSVIADPREALERAISAASPDGVVFATGSLYLVGDLRKWWNSRTAGAITYK
jgi:dihydrofolate synthase / folylpolyglutamate synthase